MLHGVDATRRVPDLLDEHEAARGERRDDGVVRLEPVELEDDEAQRAQVRARQHVAEAALAVEDEDLCWL